MHIFVFNFRNRLWVFGCAAFLVIFSFTGLQREIRATVKTSNDDAIHQPKSMHSFLTPTAGGSDTEFIMRKTLHDGKRSEEEEMLSRLERMRKILEDESSANRFYVYTDAALVQQTQRENVRQRRGNKLKLKKYGRDMLPEIELIEALEGHPLRTYNATQAQHFVIPIPVGAIFASNKHKKIYQQTFQALFRHPLFQSTQGHGHILLSLVVPLFSFRHTTFLKSSGLPLIYPKLWNVTLATDYDAKGIQTLLKSENQKELCSGDFVRNWRKKKRDKTVVDNTFSLNLYPSQKLAYREASYENFQKKSLLVFYRSRDSSSMNNSTQYRFAPFNETVVENLPKSSIGHDLPFDQWLADFTNSKFCLVIRGDSPHTHALLRSIRIGCIPVIVANCLPLYAPVLKSSLNMYDYSVILQEQMFMRDPLAALSSLQSLSEVEIKNKLQALAFAQRVTMPDHPKSLFVPAFLREATMSRQTRVVTATPMQWNETSMTTKQTIMATQKNDSVPFCCDSGDRQEKIKLSENQFLLLHLGKAGGGTILERIQQDWNYLPKEIHPNPLKPFHPPSSASMILTIRDPIDRFVSAFYWDYLVLCNPHGDKRQPAWAKVALADPEKYCVKSTPANKERRRTVFSLYNGNVDQLARDLCSTSSSSLQETARNSVRKIAHATSSLSDWLNFTYRTDHIYPIVMEQNATTPFLSQVDEAWEWVLQKQQQQPTGAPGRIPFVDLELRRERVRRRDECKQSLPKPNFHKEAHSTQRVKQPLSAEGEQCLAQYYRTDYDILQRDVQEQLCKTETCRRSIQSILDRRAALLRR